MTSELHVAYVARRRGCNREGALCELLVDPMRARAEVDKALDTIYGAQSGQPIEGGTRRSENVSALLIKAGML